MKQCGKILQSQPRHRWHNMGHAHYVPDNQAIDTHSSYVILHYCFSTAKMVTRKHLNGTLYVHYLPSQHETLKTSSLLQYGQAFFSIQSACNEPRKISARGLQSDIHTEVLDGKLQMITKSWVIATKGQQSEKSLGLDGADIIQ